MELSFTCFTCRLPRFLCDCHKVVRLQPDMRPDTICETCGATWVGLDLFCPNCGQDGKVPIYAPQHGRADPSARRRAYLAGFSAT